MLNFASVFLKTLRDRRRSTQIVSIGMFITGSYVALLWPEFGGGDALTNLIESMPAVFQELMGDIASAEGFFTTQPYSILAPIIMIAWAVAVGQGAIAGEEESATLDQLVANPVSRARLYAEKAAAMVVLMLEPVIAVAVAILLGAWLRNYDVSIGWLIAQSLSLLLLAVAVGGIALGVGAWTGSKGVAMAVASTIAGIGYLINVVEPLVDWMEPTRYISVVYYYIGEAPFYDGLVLWHALLLVAVGVLAATAGGVVFNRRDLH